MTDMLAEALEYDNTLYVRSMLFESDVGRGLQEGDAREGFTDASRAMTGHRHDGD